MRKSTLLFVLILCCISAAFSQKRQLTGKVISADDHSPLPGVSIIIQGTTRGTATDGNGEYTLELESAQTSTDNILVYSYLGYKPQTVVVANQSVINITLDPEVTTLADVVVIGYGTQRKSDLTGSVASVRGADLTKIPSSSPMQALQGKVAGVQITSGSGAPGSNPVVRIRGVGTFNNNDPIYVVDGVILDDISFINSADIESMEVLKDASATAIYGARGANGVIIVTTKRGVLGEEKPVISVSAEYSLQQIAKKIDLLNGREFAIIANEIAPGSYNNVDAVNNTDWQDEIFRTAPIQNYQVSVSGASQKVQYYTGLSYFRQDGIIAKSNFERLTIKLNNTFHLSKQLRFGNNLAFSPTWKQNTNENAVFVAYRAQPVIAPFRSDGSYSEVPNVGNPLANIEYNDNFDRGMRTVGNLFGEWDFMPGFKLRTSAGVDLNNTKNRNFIPAFNVSPQQFNEINDLYITNSQFRTFLWENTLNYFREFGNSRIDALAGYTMQYTDSEIFSARGENIARPSESFWYLNPNNLNPNSISNRVDDNQFYSMISYLFRVNYSFGNRYLLTATFRRDGSSKFTEKNRYGNFPAFAAGWNISNEAFMQSQDLITNLKLKASWGMIGNEKINYLAQYSTAKQGFNGVFGTGEVLFPGTTYDRTGNPDLKWESTTQTDIGLEIGLFQNRLTAEVDYFNKLTTDILIDLPVPAHLGNGQGATVPFNAADVLNRGFEFNLAWSSEIRDFKYRLGAVGTTIHNEVKAINNTNGYQPNAAGTTRSIAGRPLGSFYGYKVEGVFQNEAELNSLPRNVQSGVGDLRYADLSGDGQITEADRTYIGSPIPKFIYGFNAEVSYKGLALSLDFNGQTGNDILNQKETTRPDPYNFETRVLNRWTGAGTSTTNPRSSFGGVNYLISDRYIQDGSYLRLRNVTLTYNLPEVITQRFRSTKAQVYVRGTNVFTSSKFTGYSPEVGGGPLDNGIDTGIYPLSRIYSAGLNINF
ncbi:TonB-dependent receptor [Rhodocytophaga rosea]|uniref:TonB-dependent receptor n=1 Tax=Rhodocytophaga rosea TaxID=2704465 RepID=A0A6C0GEC6_9BACT|nr:TonB-dependent receptor [Rhodocytophaga rosea]QHT66335.1 TonB-dependent receptor [Rhodocytophaga rosea]